MQKLVKCAAFMALVASTFSIQGSAAEKWRSFNSSTGFSVTYPENWFRKGISKDRLVILSSKGGAEGMPIEHGQAVISVMEEEGSTTETLLAVMDRYIRDTTVVSRRDIHNEEIGSRECGNIKEVVSKERAVPPEDVPGIVPYIVNTEYFCEVNGHKYVTVLRNFEGDKLQPRYQQIALRLAESLRLGQ
jgi:hypothetical protein